MATTPRREALRLYREIVRVANKFTHNNDQGVPWRTVLLESARKEYDQARFESDPETIARLLLVGRDCVMQVQEKLAEKKLGINQPLPNPKNPNNPNSSNPNLNHKPFVTPQPFSDFNDTTKL